MKKFLSKLMPQKHPWNLAGASIGQVHSLSPKFFVPPVPHPSPYNHIALAVTSEGILLNSHVPGSKYTGEYVRIRWTGKPVKGGVRVEVLDTEVDVDWQESVVVYGIVGILELFSTSYLLVITVKSDVGHFLHPSRTVYAIKGVASIPLIEDQARIAVKALISRNAALTRASLFPNKTLDAVDPILGSESEAQENGMPADLSQRRSRVVQFAPVHQIKVLSPVSTDFNAIAEPKEVSRPASPSGSEISSEHSGPRNSVAQVVASKLSFWNRLPKQTRNPPTAVTEPAQFSAATTTMLEYDVMKEGEPPAVVLNSILTETAPEPNSEGEKYTQLEAKVVKECIREFTKGGMYFAYNFDITRSLQHKQELLAKAHKQHALLTDLNALDASELSGNSDDHIDVLAEPSLTSPLWRRVDRRFWWNEWLLKPFIDVGLHSYILPIMQGHYQISSFPIAREPVLSEEGDFALVDYIIISRRSRSRAGLRYQRRGVDDSAHTANFVETETVMRVEREGHTNVFSYVQIRGSIPLFWIQPSYGLKPAPQLSPERTHSQNLDVLRRNLERTTAQYGPHCIVNLAEQHGKEGSITLAYREYVQECACKDVQYSEYDFHKETRGMKYEKIFSLIEKLERVFDQQGYLWISDELMMSRQKGVFRVNCIDCLDRTNVVQSAFARYALNRQLGAVALLNPSEEGKMDVDVVFNDMWANNGDSISRAYAGTSALKGDYTRTGKRDLGGLLHDGVNSLARMYSSTFSDWFSQAVIDYMLGNRTISIFPEFLHNLQSTDPRDLIRLSKIRAEVIASCVSRVLNEGERLLAGWTLFSPPELNIKVTDKFEEKVLLLTVQALYIVGYDYNLEKVKMYIRLPLGDIVGITKGAYILSPLEAASRDPSNNAGFIVTWLSRSQSVRISSYSVRNTYQIPKPPNSPILDDFRGSSSLPPSHSKAATLPAWHSSGSPTASPLRKSTFSNKSLSKPPLSPSDLRGRSTAQNKKETGLSQILSSPLVTPSGDLSFAAFKALPVDPVRYRQASSGPYYAEPDKLEDARNCKEAVDVIVDTIRQACYDIGGAEGEFVVERDVVGLAEAMQMTSVYAKMEHGLKRLLWLGS